MPIVEEGVLTSFDQQTGVADVSEEFYKQNFPETPFYNEILLGGKARNTTVEWFEDQKLPTKASLAAAYTAGSGSITVDSTAGMRIDSILSLGNSVFRVTSINRTSKAVGVLIIPDNGVA